MKLLLIGGRNGLRACELAEIEPRFEKRDLNGHDGRALTAAVFDEDETRPRAFLQAGA